MSRNKNVAATLLLAGLGFVTQLLAQAPAAAVAAAPPPYEMKENYSKYEYRIVVRDGKRLLTSLLVPKDQSKSYPFLIRDFPLERISR